MKEICVTQCYLFVLTVNYQDYDLFLHSHVSLPMKFVNSGFYFIFLLDINFK